VAEIGSASLRRCMPRMAGLSKLRFEEVHA
jgi:hypothetical protein